MRSMNRWASTPTDTGATARPDRPAGRRRIGRIAAVAVTAMLASTLAPGAVAPASAHSAWNGTLDAAGFPSFFDDGNVKLALGTRAADGEAFYFGADADNRDVGGKLEVYTAALETDAGGAASAGCVSG